MAIAAIIYGVPILIFTGYVCVILIRGHFWAERVRANGRVVVATIQRVEGSILRKPQVGRQRILVEEYGPFDDRSITRYLIQCSWINPDNDIEYHFKTSTFARDPSPLVVEELKLKSPHAVHVVEEPHNRLTTLPVNIDWPNTQSYFVDTTALEEMLKLYYG